MSFVVVAAWVALWGPQRVPEFELRDATGSPVRLSGYAGDRPVVLVFLAVDCPVANLYAPRLRALAQEFHPHKVRFLAIDPMPQDASAAIARFAREHQLPFAILKDPDARVAAACGATRTPEVILLDADHQVRYRGRIDNQYGPGGTNRGRPDRSDLVEAIRELLAGGPVTVPIAPATGCLIPRLPPPKPDATVTYHRDVAPIVQAHCQVCHRTGEVAPFALTTYEDARHWAPMMVEVTANGTMPPWHANPDHGRFRNARGLTPDQRQVIARWADQGCPEGDPAHAPPTIRWPSGWAIGTPDLVLRMPTPVSVPAEGVLDYQHVLVDPGASTDLWVRAVEVRPGNRRVLHHCSVFLQPPFADGPESVYLTVGILGSHCLMNFTPGSDPIRLPPGMAKRIPAGWQLHLVLHYTPIGTPTSDQTELGLQLADPADVRKEVATKLIDNVDFRIPPGASAHRVEATWRADADCLLLSLLPHMHARGQAFRYVAEYPDRPPELLLDVPKYDFNWQHRYELAEPKRLPAGTVIRCTAVYDNSADNPANPDPTAEVRYGPQFWDEMFNGYVDIALADQDMQAPPPHDRRTQTLWGCAAVLALGLVVYRRAWGRTRDLTTPAVLT
jgi:peroxiredoxin